MSLCLRHLPEVCRVVVVPGRRLRFQEVNLVLDQSLHGFVVTHSTARVQLHRDVVSIDRPTAMSWSVCCSLVFDVDNVLKDFFG